MQIHTGKSVTLRGGICDRQASVLRLVSIGLAQREATFISEGDTPMAELAPTFEKRIALPEDWCLRQTLHCPEFDKLACSFSGTFSICPRPERR